MWANANGQPKQILPQVSYESEPNTSDSIMQSAKLFTLLYNIFLLVYNNGNKILYKLS